MAAAAAWPVLLLGIVAPRLAAFLVAFIPLSNRVPAGMIRALWIMLAVAADRRTADRTEPREEAVRIDAELGRLRDELSLLADELDRRREAVDPRVQLRRHPIKGAVAGAVLGLVGGLVLVVVRRRRRAEVSSGRTW